MAKASFVVRIGPLGQMVTAQGQQHMAELLSRFGIENWSEDGRITQDLNDTARLHVVVTAPDRANVRGFVEEMYGNLLTDEIRHELDRQLGASP